MSRHTESMGDITIAQVALEQSLLTNTVADRPLLCDVYCIPSHNHQAFYLQVDGGKGFVCGWIVIVIVVILLISFIADGASWDAIDTLLGLGLLAFLFFRWIST